MREMGAKLSLRGLKWVAIGAMVCGLAAACGAGTTGAATSGTTAAPATPTPVPSPANANAPPARVGAAVEYDPASKRLILFGGAPATGHNLWTDQPATRLDDTWAWDGQTWSELHPATSPPALYGARLVNDPSTGHLLLLGGAGDAPDRFLVQEGIWSWDGRTWSRIADNPVQEPFATAAADPASGQIAFGGIGQTGACSCTPPPAINLGGDYVSSGGAQTWTPAAGDTPSWGRAATAYDPISQRIITTDGSGQVSLQWTYAWDGHQWTRIIETDVPIGQHDPAQPFGPCNAATDDAAGRIVLACEPAPALASAATWTFDGKAWQSVAAANTPTVTADPAVVPTNNGLFSLAYDPALSAVVMVIGGASGSETMDMWNGQSWVAIQ